MSIRYGINLFALVGAGFLAVVSRTFTSGGLEWTAFGVSAAILLAAVGALARGERGRWSAAALVVLGLWSLTVALAFSGTVLGWLVLADAIAVAVLAAADLTAHEVTTERVVHTLDVRDERSVPQAA